MAKLFFITTCFFLLFISYACVEHNIKDEVVNSGQLPEYVRSFNAWHRQRVPHSNKVEVRVRPQGGVGVYALVDIKEGENFLEVPKDMTITADNVETTFIGQFIKDLSERSGFDDYTNFLYFLLHEKKLGLESKWGPFMSMLILLNIRSSSQKPKVSSLGLLESFRCIRKRIRWP
jgi:hypothetical protein